MLSSIPAAVSARLSGAAVTPVRDGQGGATVLRVTLRGGGECYLKYGYGPVAADVAAETERLSWLQGRVPCARLRDAGLDDDCAWLLTERLAGSNAGDMLSRDRAKLDRVVAGLSDFLGMLQALPVADCPFDASVTHWLPVARQRVAAGEVDADEFDPDHAGWTATDVLAKVEHLADTATGAVVAHGDFTLGNLILAADGSVTGCLDVGRLGVADPYQDIALAWRDLGGFGEHAQTAFLRAVGCWPVDTERLLLHRTLDELF